MKIPEVKFNIKFLLFGAIFYLFSVLYPSSFLLAAFIINSSTNNTKVICF